MDAVVDKLEGDSSSPRRALYVDSSLREKLIEHVFVGDLLRHLWRQNAFDVEVLRAEVDRGGYDLVFECNRIIRHVQFKSSHRGAKTSEVAVNLKLVAKPSGCVIWVLFDQDTLQLGPFLWFGGAPGEPLPSVGDKVARHSKGNALGRKVERPNLRVVRRKRFTVLATMEDVIAALFGRSGDTRSA